MDNQIIGLYAESQIHAGKGTDVGIIDLPIQRERTTDLPIIQGVKGCLRASRCVPQEIDTKVFGKKPSSEGADQAGSVVFSEAKTLAFPVRSPQSIFLWVTCPLILSRFSRIAFGEERHIPKLHGMHQVCDSQMLKDGKLGIEEMSFTAQAGEEAKYWSGVMRQFPEGKTMQEHMQKNLAILDDQTMVELVKSTTEVIPRIRIDVDTGTVKKGALWYEEYLPQDTLMYFIIRNASITGESLLGKVAQALDGTLIIIGGNETVGKGLAWLKVMKEV